MLCTETPTDCDVHALTRAPQSQPNKHPYAEMRRKAHGVLSGSGISVKLFRMWSASSSPICSGRTAIHSCRTSGSCFARWNLAALRSLHLDATWQLAVACLINGDQRSLTVPGGCFCTAQMSILSCSCYHSFHSLSVSEKVVECQDSRIPIPQRSLRSDFDAFCGHILSLRASMSLGKRVVPAASSITMHWSNSLIHVQKDSVSLYL